MATYTAAPWWADAGDEVIVIRGSDGDSICAMKKNTGDRLPEEQEANAALIALAPELFRSVCELVAMARNALVDNAFCLGDLGALDDAEALLDLLADVGVALDGAEEAADGVVVIPLPMMQPPVVVAAFKANNGDVAFIVHADDEPKTFIGQYGIAPPLFAWARSSLQDDGPLCGVLRNGRVVGEIGFYPGRILKLMLGGQVHSVELAQEDLADIVSLFGEN